MKVSSAPRQGRDIFNEARHQLTITDAWVALGLPGTPKPSCRSPFRDERSPSFSIFDDGKGWKDHGSGEGGDVVEFILHAIDGDHKEVRNWLAARLTPGAATSTAPKPSATIKRINWPSKLTEGDRATLKAFAASRGLTFPSVQAMAQAGILRFTIIHGNECFVITDASGRCAEIRRIDGKLFGDKKQFPLAGVNKQWLPGIDLLRTATKSTAVIITEGATDLLSACDLYSRYRREHGGKNSWQPAALLGAECKTLDPEAAQLIRGRHVRLVPDADPAGDKMADHWASLLRKIGCSVDVVNLPPGTDLTDNLNSISPTDLFSK